MKSSRRRGMALFLFALSLALAAVSFRWMRRPDDASPPPATPVPTDPRLTYRGPFTNIDPAVAYIDNDSRCVPCHNDICASYRLHPMARSLASIAEEAKQEILDADHHNPFFALDFRFDIERRGNEIRHRIARLDADGRSVIRAAQPVHFAIGSGTRGRSYLTNREGRLSQTPISWFAQKQIWDLSPGFGLPLLSGRPVDGQCMYCHANRAHFRENSVNRFDDPPFSGESIGCERCHGPAERHLTTRGQFDIVNPKRLSTPELRDSICEQCHLKGKMRVVRYGRGLNDFRPGLPLSQFFRIFVASTDAEGKDKSISQSEQMHESRCYRAALKRKDDLPPLGCVSCHDPHRFVTAETRVAHYRNRCLKCHDSIPCSLAMAERHRRQPDDSCIACHMPRFGTADIAHTAATDHRIPRVPATKPEGSPTNDRYALKPFHPYRPEEESELRRDLGLAWVELMKIQEAAPQVYGEPAEALLGEAVRERADDVPAREALGLSQFFRGRERDALATLETTLGFDPNRETALNAVASLTLSLGRLEESLEYWRRLTVENPWQPSYRRALTELLVRLGHAPEARTQCQAWLRLEPMSAAARRTWIFLLLRDNKRSEAREQLRQLEALKPADLARVRAWFDDLPR